MYLSIIKRKQNGDDFKILANITINMKQCLEFFQDENSIFFVMSYNIERDNNIIDLILKDDRNARTIYNDVLCALQNGWANCGITIDEEGEFLYFDKEV